MGKRYVVTEESGCGGCGTLIVGAIILSFISTYLPVIAGIAALLLIIWLIIYIPKFKANKQKQKEENELAERERQLNLEQKRMELEARERELRNKWKENSNDSWDDF